MSKDKRPIERPKYDTQLMPSEIAPRTLLTLPDSLKKYLNENGLDFRFLNAQQFRANGNYHKTQWIPFKVTPDMAADLGIPQVTSEGHIQRRDLILGVRTKALSSKYKEEKYRKNKALSNYSKTEAKKMRDDARQKGLGDHISVEEGYDEEDGFKSV